jgi:BirA family biotin operon repressor/biotin-[acetyl-CoA-carboxylase] ligase
MADRPFLSRQQRFASLGSTNDVARAWLADGTPEVCLVVADEQTAGRGRNGRSWTAPAGRALLLSLGFRPTGLPADRAWQLAAIVSLAMADAAEATAGLPDGAIRLKWPNDLVIEMTGPSAPLLGELTPERAREILDAPPAARKLAGVLGETEGLGETGGLGSADPRVVVGLGINADWPAAEFPDDLAATMTSLHDASGGRPIDLAMLLDAFLTRLEVRHAALVAGRFDVADWTSRQLTNGRPVRLDLPDGTSEVVIAAGVDARSGALLVADAPGGPERPVLSGEIVHLRLAERAPDLDPDPAPVGV